MADATFESLDAVAVYDGCHGLSRYGKDQRRQDELLDRNDGQEE
jgi:hypothetical protein